MILQNVRQPELLWGDLQSQIASLNIGAAGIERLAAQARRGALRACAEAAARCVGGRHARRHRPHSRRDLRVRGQDRRRRHHRRADRHPRQGDRRRRRDDGRPDGLQPAVPGAEQRDPGVHLLGRLLRADGDGRRAGRLQCRLLSARQGHRAAGLVRERGLAGAGGASHRHRPPAGDRAVRRAAQGGAASACRRPTTPSPTS